MSVKSGPRLRAALVSVALVALMSLGLTSSAAAGGTKPPPRSTFNNATVNISGGNATALSACLNVAKVSAKHEKKYGKKVKQSNFCKNVATATGGSVTLKNVNILVLQSGDGGTTRNNATVNITGGDATAIAACVNYLRGTASASQTNVCANKATAKGGDVSLKNVDITIVQGGGS